MFVTYKPCKNAPLIRACDMPNCDTRAIVDCPIVYTGQWAYLCTEHFMQYGSKDANMVNNITDSDISITL